MVGRRFLVSLSPSTWIVANATLIGNSCWVIPVKRRSQLYCGDGVCFGCRAAKRGLEVTMMERIVAKQADSAVRMLTTQYR